MHGWLRVALAAAVVCTAALVEAAHRYANCAVQLAEVAARGFDVALWEPLTECQLLHPPSFTRLLIAHRCVHAHTIRNAQHQSASKSR